MGALDNYFVIFSIVSGVLLIVVIGFIYGSIIEKRENSVLKNSSRLKLIREVNQKYTFFEISNISLQTHVDSKAKLDSFSFDKYLKNLIYENQDYYLNIINMVENNKTNYVLYTREIMERYPKDVRKDVEKSGVSPKYYYRIEKQLLRKKAKKPTRDITLKCTAIYESPKGRNYYDRKAEYHIQDITRIYQSVKNMDSRKAKMQRERSLVTPKLRYRVFQRDGFRCKICGRSEADGAVLHVDHIIPVSKGGKTEMSNLQTLCDYCNIGKGASYGFSPNYSSSAKG